MHLVGFTIEIYYDARSYKLLISNWILSFKIRHGYLQYLSQKRNRSSHCAESNFMFVATSVKVTYIGY